MHIHYDCTLPLYHGTIDLYSKNILKNGMKLFSRHKGGTDFGPGFYLTTKAEQATDWAKRRADKPVLNKHILEMTNMTVRDFMSMRKDFNLLF